MEVLKVVRNSPLDNKDVTTNNSKIGSKAMFFRTIQEAGIQRQRGSFLNLNRVDTSIVCTILQGDPFTVVEPHQLLVMNAIFNIVCARLVRILA